MIEDILRALLKAPPSQRRVRQDLAFMVDQIKDWKEAIIPWEADQEMELLSLNQEYKWVKHSPGKILKGVLNSIYHEPMVAYAYKAYLKGGQFSLCLAATKSHQFIFQRLKVRTDFFIDGEHVGFITPEWLVYSQRRRLLARRNRYSSDYYTVVVWDQEVAQLRDPKRIDRVNPRAFEVMAKLSEKEQLLLMAIAFLTIIEESHGLTPD